MDESKQILMYESQDGNISVEVKLENDSVWLTQGQMAELFGQTKQNVSLHIRNIFKENELNENLVVKESLTTATDGKNYKQKYYNLDVIISVGYRVKSFRGTQFRIWANQVLKDYLLKGYAIDQKRFQKQTEQLEELRQAVRLLGNIVDAKQLNSDEATGLLKVLSDYAYALDILDKYDHQVVEITGTTSDDVFVITYESAMNAIAELKKTFGGSSLFGNEKDESFKGSLAAIYQTFGGESLYSSVEEKAAHLLYFIVKNHSFSDGNKRIAAFIFVWFMEKNGLLYKEDGAKRIADNALVALTLMIAESKPAEKEIMIKVVVNLINNKN